MLVFEERMRPDFAKGVGLAILCEPLTNSFTVAEGWFQFLWLRPYAEKADAIAETLGDLPLDCLEAIWIVVKAYEHHHPAPGISLISRRDRRTSALQGPSATGWRTGQLEARATRS